MQQAEIRAMHETEQKDVCIHLIWLHEYVCTPPLGFLLHLNFYFLLYLLRGNMADNKEHVASLGDSIARPTSAVGNGELNRISDFEVALSYNWLEGKNPTILVPGRHSYCSLSCLGPRGFTKSLLLQAYPIVESTSHCSCSET